MNSVIHQAGRKLTTPAPKYSVKLPGGYFKNVRTGSIKDIALESQWRKGLIARRDYV
jgi:hypothetical protein